MALAAARLRCNMRRHINGGRAGVQGVSLVAFATLAAGFQTLQSFAAITAKGDSINRTGATVPPREAANGMQHHLPHPCLLEHERYVGGLDGSPIRLANRRACRHHAHP
ncbi:hypothetical protein [Sphingobium sp. YR768]|uniref:hypothetical protein n=1 Tax=Sphingobium sp. YR768 TaxID=1884365 RepID=UPI0008CEE6A0|nr:hypothetical protein [Sphingobium sp. YR768]SER35331.1 hypothetical protein SAMN05518866_10997 [Sphingobium sp. YR768]